MVRAVPAALALVLASSCMPLYIPPVPAEVPAPEPIQVLGQSRLELQGDELVAVLEIENVDEPGWLSFQWYDPTLRQVASDSVWLEAREAPIRQLVGMPRHVGLVPGTWRVVVAFEGRVLRQLEADVLAQDVG